MERHGKRVLVAIVLIMAFFGMYWVSAAEKFLVEGVGSANVNDYDWLDVNDYNQGDKLMPVPNVPAGSRVGGGFVPNESWVEGRFFVIVDNNDITWALDDANNLWGWEFVAPNEPGVYYARFQTMVTEPYPAGSEYWTLAFQVVPQLHMELRWWYKLFN